MNFIRTGTCTECVAVRFVRRGCGHGHPVGSGGMMAAVSCRHALMQPCISVVVPPAVESTGSLLDARAASTGLTFSRKSGRSPARAIVTRTPGVEKSHA